MLLRQFDEGSKVSGLKVPPMVSYRERLVNAVVHPRRTPQQITGSFIRDGNCLVDISLHVA